MPRDRSCSNGNLAKILQELLLGSFINVSNSMADGFFPFLNTDVSVTLTLKVIFTDRGVFLIRISRQPAPTLQAWPLALFLTFFTFSLNLPSLTSDRIPVSAPQLHEVIKLRGGWKTCPQELLKLLQLEGKFQKWRRAWCISLEDTDSFLSKTKKVVIDNLGAGM